MDAVQLVVTGAVGLVAGVINTLAGGGSFLTLPALVFLGLPTDVANGTNRVGVALQGATSLATFQRQGRLDLRRGLLYVLATAPGAALGATLSLAIDEATLKRAVAVLLVVLGGTIFIDPKRWSGREPLKLPGGLFSRLLVFFCIGVYGGFIQAGVGLLLVAALTLLEGMDLVRANALKALLVLTLTVPALVIFIANDRVAWLPGLCLAVGSALGGWAGAHIAIGAGEKLLRYALFAALAVSAVKLLGLF